MNVGDAKSIQVSSLLSAFRERLITLGALLGVALFLAAPFVIRAVHAALEYEVIREKEIIVADLESQLGIPPAFNETEDPLAVLVLDVSGSMKDSDPDFEQLNAVRNFLRIFQHMAAGAGSKESTPHVAVIVYNEIALVGAHGSGYWISVDSYEEALALSGELEALLGSSSPQVSDPRRGLNTDHRAAARLAKDVIYRYRSQKNSERPACVVFMTDGIHDPSPLTDAGLSLDRLSENRSKFWANLQSSALSQGPASRARLSAIRDEFEPYLNTEPIGSIQLGDTERDRQVFPLYHLRHALREALGDAAYRSALANLQTAVEDTVLSLRSELGLSGGDVFRFIRLGLAPGEIPDAAPGEGILNVSRAEDLTASFVGVLAEWLNLHSCSVSQDHRVRVPLGVRSLAVVIESDGSTVNGTLRGPSANVQIVSGLALLGNPIPGDWSVDTGQSPVRSIEAWADPRFRWAFGGVPKSYGIFDPPVEWSIGLYSMVNQRLVLPESLYVGPPQSASLTMNHQDGTRSEQTLEWSKPDTCFKFSPSQSPGQRPGLVRMHALLHGLTFRDRTNAEPEIVQTETSFREAIEVRFELVRRDGSSRRIGGIRDLKVGRGSYVGAQ